MSSRPSPPIQPDPKSRLYRAQAVPGHTMAAISFPPIAPHVLPPSHVASNPRPSIPPPSHLQPLFIPPSPRMQLKHSDFSLHHRSLNSVQSPYSEAPQPQSHSREQGAVPLGRLLHTSPYTPSTSISPLSPSYPQQTFDSLLYREIPHETVYLHSSRDHERSHVYSSYQHQQNSPTTHTSSSSTPISFATAPAQIERSMARQQKAPDITDRYNLFIRQQPIAARACGFGERDRRVIDPPPIVQLSLTDFDPKSPSDVSELRWPFNVVHCALLSLPSQSSTTASTADVTTVADPNNANKLSRRLMGTLVASPFIGIDPDAPASSDANSRLGCFFVFPDLSCRQNGFYRLRFTLMKVNVEMTPTGGRSSIVGAVESDVFEVFSAKDFPGMRASTALTKELKRQGAAVSVKKGNEAKAGKKGKKRGSSISKSGSDASDSDGRGQNFMKKKIKDGDYV